MSDKRAARGAALLRDAGFERVSVLRGGMQNWKQIGYPVEYKESTSIDHPGHQDSPVA
jgi:rhodanese-related sulfurtransferase